MRTIDSGSLQALFQSGTAYVWLPALTLTYDSNTLRLVANTENVTLPPAEVYTACPFEFALPDDDEETAPQIQVSVDAVGPLGKQLIREFQSLVTPPVGAVALIRGVKTSTGWAYTKELAQSNWTVNSLGVTPTAITLSMGFNMKILDEPATIGRFIPAVAPGLFR